MAKGITQEERQLVKLVELLPIAEGEKTALAERIRNGEMSEDLANEIHQKVAGMEESADDERGQVNRQRFLTELSMLVRRWRLSNQSKNFGKR